MAGVQDRAGSNAADGARLPSLLDTTARNFTIREVSADKAYASVNNFDAIDRHNATPLIPFKSSHTGSARGLFA